jgi:hypothetical protein
MIYIYIRPKTILEGWMFSAFGCGISGIISMLRTYFEDGFAGFAPTLVTSL